MQYQTPMTEIARHNLELPRGYRIPARAGSEQTDELLLGIYPALPEQAVIGIVGTNSRSTSTVAIKLATRAADHLLVPALTIDANPYDRLMGRHFRCSNPGLVGFLNQHDSLLACLQPTKVKNLSVLGIGNRQLMKQMTLHSALLSEARQDFRFTIVHMPPLNRTKQLSGFLRQLDGVIVVTRCGDSISQLADLESDLRAANAEVLSTVVLGKGSAVPQWLQRLL